MRNEEKGQREPRVVLEFVVVLLANWQFAGTQRRGSSSYTVASGSCRWRKEAAGIAANWFPCDHPLAQQCWNSNFGMRCAGPGYSFRATTCVDRVGSGGVAQALHTIGSPHEQCHASDEFSFSRSKAEIRSSRYSRHTRFDCNYQDSGKTQ